MKCEIFRNENKIAGPIEFNPVAIRDIVARQGGNSDLVPPTLTSAVKINGTIVIKPVREVRPNLTAGQRYGSYERTESDFDVTYTYAAVDKSEDELRSALMERLSNLHNEFEGKRFEYQGVMIKADLEARINAQAALNAIASGAATTLEWRGKAPASNTLDPFNSGNADEKTNARIVINGIEDMTALYGAVVTYLTKGFAARSAVEEELKAANREALIQYNVKGKFDAIANA